MATIGQIGEYVESKEEFECYIERIEQFFEANQIAEGKQVAVLLTVIGAPTYSLLKSLLAPERPSSKKLAELVSTLKNHFSPKPSVIAERFKFHGRYQKEGESIAQYIVELRKLASTCDFGSFLSESLRDRFVCGLRDRAIQKKLLSVVDLTFKRASELALAMEIADKNTQEFKPFSGSEVKNVSRETARKGRGQFSDRTKFQGFQTGTKSKGLKCFRCAGSHAPNLCKFKEEKCYNCSKKGHIAKVCRAKHFKSKVFKTKYVDQDDSNDEDPTEEELGLYGVYTMPEVRKYQVNIRVDNENIVMEIDTGAAVSIIPQELYETKLSHLPLSKSKVVLKTYSGERLQVLGEVQLPVQYQGQSAKLTAFIVKGNNPALLGRDWLTKLKLDWSRIFTVKSESVPGSVTEVLDKYSSLFSEGYGTVKDFKAQIHLKENVQPKFCKARTVPFALKEAVDKELDRLEAEGIIYKVDCSEWATPVVVVPKADKSVRLCGDYKVTVNPCIEVPQHPLPAAEEIFATLTGGTVFTKLDLAHAYQQLELDEHAQELLTINTHRGLYRYKRLPFGVSSAPAIFQAVLEHIIRGLERVRCRLDDILVNEKSTSEHLKLLDEVLRRLEQHGIKLRKSKCVFLQPYVEYLGHGVDKEGIHPLPEKVEAIRNAPVPIDVSQLKSYLGLLNYYAKFIPNLSTTLQPLYELLQQRKPWNWTPACEKAFQQSKQKLADSSFLAHYDLSKPMKLATDASAYGVGAVISHVFQDGSERPIAFASRTLSASEKNYSQLQKEALAIIFGVKKFHQYLYG